jgi:hypothetical protein
MYIMYKEDEKSQNRRVFRILLNANNTRIIHLNAPGHCTHTNVYNIHV